MRRFFLITAVFFTVFGLIFTILPMEKFGVIAAFVAAVFSVTAYHKSEITNTNFPKYLSMIAVATLFVAVYFAFFTKSEQVVVDPQFEQQKIEAAEQDQQDLKDLEDL